MRWVDLFGREYGWTIDDVMKLPYGDFLALTDIISARIKRE